MSNNTHELVDPPRNLVLPSSLPPVPAVVLPTTSNFSSGEATSKAPLNIFDPRFPLPDNERDPLYLASPQTWAERNPTVGVQKPRLRAKLTDAAKASKLLAADRNKINAALLTADIEKLMLLQQGEIEKIATVHNRKVSDIEKRVNNRANYRHSRAPSLANALTHKKMIELNEGMKHSSLLIFVRLMLIVLSGMHRKRCWRQSISGRDPTGERQRPFLPELDKGGAQRGS